MLSKILVAWCLMAVCVAIHANGVTQALRWVPGRIAARRRSTWLFVTIAGWMVLLHVVEVSAWAFIYVVGRALPDLPTSLYFSAVTYTTTGYGDVVLPVQWRLVGAIEALTGILMCGWSTGFFFAAVSRVLGGRSPNA
jgi:voltage-gated potassium channel Kch